MGLAGYRTILSGKWHLGSGDDTHPFQRGFDAYYGLLDGCCNFFNPSQPDPKYKGGKVRSFGQDNQRITQFPPDFYTTDAFTDHAIAQVQAAVAEQQPFFLHVCYTAPHYPLHAKPEDIAKYRGKFTMGWDAMRRQRYERQIAMGLLDPTSCKLSEGDSRRYDWETADHEFEDLRMAVYAAMIDAMDQNIGRLMRALEEAGVDDNTLVLFLSDNGGCSEEPGGRDPAERTPGPGSDYVAVGPAWGWAQNAPFRRYKSWVHEGGITTPLIAWWPGKVPAESWCREPAHIMDFMPTFLELAAGAYPMTFRGQEILPVEGKTMLPLLQGRERRPHDQLCWEWSGNRAIREGDMKLVWDKDVKQWELYDLAKDRTETINLADQQPGRVEAMSAAWGRWAERTGLR